MRRSHSSPTSATWSRPGRRTRIRVRDGPRHRRAAPPICTCAADIEALIARPVFYELVEMAQERETEDGPQLGVSSNGAWFPVGPAKAHLV
ncbi:MAG: hypothetical protein WDM85_14400 [Caulobacteraceae bacterium]